MKHYRYDLHIHSALSPCADRLMSPNNILNMSHLVGLEIIAVTDHNSFKQTFVLNELSKSYNFLYVFGVEITTLEGLHVLCYFQTEEHAKQIDQLLESDYESKPNLGLNNNQMIYDEYDNELFHWNQNLYLASSINIVRLSDIVSQLKGIIILAHIERYNDEMIAYLFDHKELFHWIEVNTNQDVDQVANRIPWIKNCNIIRNSDAHQLLDIGRHVNTIQLEELTTELLFQHLRGQSNE